MVVLLGALMMHGFLPGPLLIKEAPQLLYASVTGLLGGDADARARRLVHRRALLKLVTFDRSLVLIGALCMTMIGVFAMERSVFDVFLLVLFGTIGYFMLRYGYSTAGAAIGFVLGARLETNLRSGLLLFGGDVWVFVSRPWTATILLSAGAPRLRHLLDAEARPPRGGGAQAGAESIT